jgi:hypothetical protein
VLEKLAHQRHDREVRRREFASQKERDQELLTYNVKLEGHANDFRNYKHCNKNQLIGAEYR